MTTSEIESLLERVRKATGPDRELDADIDVALFGGETVWKQANYTMEMHPASRRPSAHHLGGWVNEYVPLYTASVDACLAMIERVLPGWLVCIDQLSYGWDASLVEYDRASKMVTDDYSAEAKTAPLALLEALLLALLHQASKRMIDAD